MLHWQYYSLHYTIFAASICWEVRVRCCSKQLSICPGGNIDYIRTNNLRG